MKLLGMKVARKRFVRRQPLSPLLLLPLFLKPSSAASVIEGSLGGRGSVTLGESSTSSSSSLLSPSSLSLLPPSTNDDGNARDERHKKSGARDEKGTSNNDLDSTLLHRNSTNINLELFPFDNERIESTERGLSSGGTSCSTTTGSGNVVDGGTFRFDLHTDNYAFETSWILKRNSSSSDGIEDTMIVSGPPPSTRYRDVTQYTGSMCLERGTYALEVMDAPGDGICCFYGLGSFEAWVDGVKVAGSIVGGEDFSTKSTVFEVLGGGDDPTASPSGGISTEGPTTSPSSDSPSINIIVPDPFVPGSLTVRDVNLGLDLSTGLSVRRLAIAGQRVSLTGAATDEGGSLSAIPFHGMLDGAAVISLPSSDDGGEGGYVYVSNAERRSKNGGVYGLYFDADGRVTDYKALLEGTTRNCSGGPTPWNTWISCEEYGNGQCWQIDPDPAGINHANPMQTVLGGDGGNYEAVACDNSDPDRPTFYITEDHRYGVLRRYVASGNGWDALHADNGSTLFLNMNLNGNDENGGRFEWTANHGKGKQSAFLYHPNLEGIDHHDGKLYFVSKRIQRLFILDLEARTFIAEDTGARLFGDGSFENQPDGLIRGDDGGFGGGQYLYFTEDGGRTPGVYLRDEKGDYQTVFEAYSEVEGFYKGDESVGLALSPDGTKMYAGFQDCGCVETGEADCGCLFEFSRDDGMSFNGVQINLKHHGGTGVARRRTSDGKEFLRGAK